MEKNNDKMRLSTALNKEDAANVIEALAEALKEGLLDLKKNSHSITMAVPDIVNLEIISYQNKDKSSLSIEVNWKNLT